MKSRKGLILWQVEWNLINYKSPSGRIVKRKRKRERKRERERERHSLRVWVKGEKKCINEPQSEVSEAASELEMVLGPGEAERGFNFSRIPS